jgi:hypothetical protein
MPTIYIKYLSLPCGDVTVFFDFPPLDCLVAPADLGRVPVGGLSKFSE